ncbi:MAG: 3-phosphoshikimate 1-carboxyvinyltransferase [Pseudomonadales bacterium]|nr:3-phosphoshikimate 1-carboxyvinyltransferase [Pseudomonadales bacterium]NRA17440.1 3-phosphoshikimate 1-carboxyvinyltransferase [Oceanospirillaceae bacterium]
MKSLDAENAAARDKLKNDLGLRKLLERMPKSVQDSFSEEQLANIKIAIAARTWGNHAIDLRSTFKFFRYRYYYVFVAGRNRRELSARERRIGLLIQAVALSAFLTFSALLGILVLYLIKSAAGIDIIPGFSFGVWGWFKGEFL